MTTVRERLLEAGINADTVEERLRQGWVRVDGDIVTDGDQQAGVRVGFFPPPITEYR